MDARGVFLKVDLLDRKLVNREAVNTAEKARVNAAVIGALLDVIERPAVEVEGEKKRPASVLEIIGSITSQHGVRPEEFLEAVFSMVESYITMAYLGIEHQKLATKFGVKNPVDLIERVGMELIDMIEKREVA